MGSAFDHTTFMKDNDFVDMRTERKAVSNDDRRLVTAHGEEMVYHLLLGRWVECGGRFIENEKICLLGPEHHTRQCQALPLAARELSSPLEFLRDRDSECVIGASADITETGESQHLTYFTFGWRVVQPTEGEVVLQGEGELGNILGHEGETFAIGVDIEGLNVMSILPDHTLGWRVKTADQRGERRFSGTVLADDNENGAMRDTQ